MTLRYLVVAVLNFLFLLPESFKLTIREGRRTFISLQMQLARSN
jgi:hypothetical protein